jgi:hypothetical protein
MNVEWSHSTAVLAAQNDTGRTHLWNFICTSIIFSTSKNPVNIMLHWIFIITYVHLFLNLFGHDFTVLCDIQSWMRRLFWEVDWCDMEGGIHKSFKDLFLLFFDWTGVNYKRHPSGYLNSGQRIRSWQSHLWIRSVNLWATALLIQNICEGLIKY